MGKKNFGFLDFIGVRCFQLSRRVLLKSSNEGTRRRPPHPLGQIANHGRRVSAVIKATGAECDCERVKLVVEAVKDKSLEELINEGNQKLAAVMCLGAASASPAAAASAAPAAEKPALQRPKKKLKKLLNLNSMLISNYLKLVLYF